MVLWKPGCSYEPTKSEVDGEWEDSVTLRPNLTRSATLWGWVKRSNARYQRVSGCKVLETETSELRFLSSSRLRGWS